MGPMGASTGSSLILLRDLLGAEPSPIEMRRLSDRQLEELIVGLEDYFLAWRPPPRRPGEFRVCISDRYTHNRDRLSDLVLWAHRVVVRDPLEEWLDMTAGLGWTDALRDVLAAKVGDLRDLQLAIDHDAVILAPYPAWVTDWGTAPATRESDPFTEKAEFWASVAALAGEPDFAASVIGPLDADAWRRTLAEGDPDDPRADMAWRLGELERIPQGWISEVEVKAGTKVKRLAHCSHSDARFVPFSASDEPLLRLGVPEARADGNAGMDEGVFQTLLAVTFPRLDGLSTSDALLVRRDEESFERWRHFIADLMLDSNAKARAAGVSLQDLVNDNLDAVIRDAREAVSRSAALKKYAAGEMRVRVALLTAAAAVAASTGSAAPAVVPALQFAIDVLRAGMPRAPSDPPGVVVRMLRSSS